MRAAILRRVSTDEQTDGFSLDAQERACSLYCQLQNWTIMRVYSDDGYSGRSDDRPGLQAMIKDIKAGIIQVVIVHKLDRLARNLHLLLSLVQEWERKGVRFVSVVEQIDFSTPFGRMMLQILGSVAEWYSNNLGEETRKGLTQKARQGLWVGPVPLGYTRAGQSLVPSDDAPLVQQIFSLYTSGGHSYTSIADELNTQTGSKRFTRELIRGILKNEAYTGLVMSSGQQFAGQHEALVSKSVWQAAAAQRSERSGGVGKNVGNIRRGGLLLGIVYCERCGAKLWFQYSDGEATYYICSNRSRRLCNAPFSRARDLEAQVLALIGSMQLPPDWRTRVLERAKQMQHQQQRPAQIIDSAQLHAKLKRLAQLYEDGLKSPEEYAADRDAIKAHLAQTEPGPTPRAIDINQLASLVADFPKLVALAPAANQRAIIKSILARAWANESILKAITPTQLYEPLIGVIAGRQTIPSNCTGWLMGLNTPELSTPVYVWTAFQQPWSPAIGH